MVKYTNSPQNLDAVYGALADPTRRDILARLTRGQATVGELAAPFEMSIAAVSKHLGVLEQAGLVDRTRKGRTTECTLRPDALRTARDWIATHERYWAERLADLERVLMDETN
jgi:DNA-binding transcriptional ArsR family regulator